MYFSTVDLKKNLIPKEKKMVKKIIAIKMHFLFLL